MRATSSSEDSDEDVARIETLIYFMLAPETVRVAPMYLFSAYVIVCLERAVRLLHMCSRNNNVMLFSPQVY